jgi:hypothetical protein
VAPVVKTRWLLSAVARLTGVKGTSVNEGQRFRVVVTTSDGHKHAINLQVDDHPKETRPYQLNQLADTLCLDRKDIITVLEDWTPDQLQAHLGQQTKDALTPPRHRRG